MWDKQMRKKKAKRKSRPIVVGHLEKMCFVDFEHFARFADYWLVSGSGLPADLYEDDIVDWLDVDEFVYEWLYYCPYDWPLK